MKRSGVQKLHQLFFLLLLSVITIIASCGGSGGGGDSATTTANNTPSTGQSTLSGTVQPDPGDPTASGQNANATVYVVGQQDTSATTDSNGNFSLNVNPALSGTVLSSPSLFSRIFQAISSQKTYGLVVISAGKSHGRKVEVGITEGQSNPLSTIHINTVGSISGKAFLQNATDHTGIMVYVPGTSFMATTAADGSFKISNVPSGTYDFVRAEKTGTTYHYAVVSNITVNSNADTKVSDLLLQLSAGANGQALINGGSAFTTSNTVNLAIATSSNAVLMQISEDPNMAGASWQPVAATKQFTFSGNYVTGGTATVWVKFADASGLESSPVSASIYIDANPLATLVSPVSLTNNSKPMLDWDYSHPISNPKYHVQLAADLSFAVPLMDVTNLTASQHTLTSALPVGTYYWRVAIIDGNGREWNWSYPWSLKVDLSTVSLASPVNGSVIDNKTPALAWEANSNAAQYVVTISTNPDLSGGTHYTRTATSTASSPITALPETSSTIYYWAVTPYDGNSIPGTRSDIWDITVDTVDPVGGVISSTVYSGISGTGALINNGEPFTTRRNVALSLSATDTSGVGIDGWYASESGTTPMPDAAGWNAISPAAVTYSANVLFSLSSGNGSKTVHVWFKDRAGNVSSACTGVVSLAEFITEMIDVGGVGQYSSLSLATSASPDVNNKAHISYYDSSNGDLKYVTNQTTDGTWSIVTLDSTGDVGKYSSIATSPGFGFSRISYYDETNNQLKMAAVYTIHGAQGWIFGALNAPGDGGKYSSVVQDASSQIIEYVSYFGVTPYKELKYTVATASSAISAATPTTVDTYGTSPAIKGTHTAMDRDGSSKMHISYYDEMQGYDLWGNPMQTRNLKYATNATGSWVTETVDSSGDVGQYSSIVVNKTDGRAHISYYDLTNGALKYATKLLSETTWSVSTIDSGSVGMYTDISLDSSGNAHISYYDVANGRLKYATNTYGGRWGKDIVDSGGYVGQFSSIATDSIGNPHISYYDFMNGALKYATSAP